MRNRNEQTLERKLQKEIVKAEKELKRLMGKKFACVPDAENEAKNLASKLPYNDLKDMQIATVTEKAEKKRGRPKRDELLNHLFRIEGKIDINEEALAEERRTFGRFVLASNDVSLDPEIVTEKGKIIKVSVNLSSTQITILSMLGQKCKYYNGMN